MFLLDALKMKFLSISELKKCFIIFLSTEMAQLYELKKFFYMLNFFYIFNKYIFLFIKKEFFRFISCEVLDVLLCRFF